MHISSQPYHHDLQARNAPSAEADVQQRFQEQFTAQAGNKDAFHALLRRTFGPDYDVRSAESYRQAALAGDTTWLPEVRFVSAETLQGGLGAYDAAQGVVYLNESLEHAPELAAATYAEEVGHFLDQHLTRADTAGDEGAVFRTLLADGDVSDAELSGMRAEDDSGFITVGGRTIAVEFRSASDLMVGYDPEDDDADAIAQTIVNDPELFASLNVAQRGALILGLFDGSTGDAEESAALKLLLEGTSREELLQLVNAIGWDTIRDELESGQIDQISQALAARQTTVIDELFTELGLAHHAGMSAEDVLFQITERVASLSDVELRALIERVLGPDGNANELLDAVAELARTGRSGQQSEILADLKGLVRELVERAGGDARKDLVRLGHQIAYTERLVENLKHGDYASLVSLLPDLFDPQLDKSQRQALRETLRRFEPEIRATELLILERGDVEQRSKLGRFMNARREAIDIYDRSGGQLPKVGELQGFLNQVSDASNAVLAELGDFRQMFALAVKDVTGLLDDAIGKAFDHSDDDEARELINLLNSKEGRSGEAASLLAYLPFDRKVELINDVIDSGFADGVLEDDEQAILDVLRETLEQNPAEFFRLVGAVGYAKLETHVNGAEWDEFTRLVNAATAALAA